MAPSHEEEAESALERVRRKRASRNQAASDASAAGARAHKSSGSGRQVLQLGLVVGSVVAVAFLAFALYSGVLAASSDANVAAGDGPESPGANGTGGETGDSDGTGARAGAALTRASLRWHARITSVRGRMLEPGTACELAVVFELEARVLARVGATLSCGGARLYDSGDTSGGLSFVDFDAVERAREAPAGFEYRLRYEDRGSPATRGQITLDSGAERAAVWRDGAEPYRIELALESWSEPRAGARLFAP